MWTEFAPRQIAEKMAELGTPVSPHVVRVWLEEEGLALHKIAKVLAGGLSPDRDAQFQRIALLKAEYLDAGNPVFSLDTKAKERLGQLYRKGRVWTQHAFQAFDHDFPSWANGVVIPHGIYDLARHCGHINVGLSHDTSLFACDSLRWYWETHRPALLSRGHVHSVALRLWREQLGQSVPVQTRPTSVGRRPGYRDSRGRTIPATVRSTTRSNAVSSRTLVVLVRCAVRHAGHSRPADAECLNKDRSQDHRQHHSPHLRNRTPSF